MASSLASKSSIYFLVASLINAGAAFAILPHLARVFELGKFGQLVLVLAIIQLASTISDFAFNITSSDKLSACSDGEAVEYFKVVSISRAITTLVAASIAAVVAFTLLQHASHATISAVWFAVVASALLPSWHYLSTGDSMKYAALIAAAKFPAILAVSAFVDSHSSLPDTLLLLYGPSCVLGLFEHVRLWRRPLGARCSNRLQAAIKEIQGNLIVFASLFAVSMYSGMALPLLAIFADSRSVALYSFADKLLAVVRLLLGPIFQAGLPAVGKARLVSPASARRVIFRAFATMSAIGLIFAAAFLFQGEELLVLAFGENARGARDTLWILAPVPVALAASHAFVSLGLLGSGKKRYWSALIGFGALIHVCVFVGLLNISVAAITGMAVALVACESFLALAGIWIFFSPKGKLSNDIRQL